MLEGDVRLVDDGEEGGSAGGGSWSWSGSAEMRSRDSGGNPRLGHGDAHAADDGVSVIAQEGAFLGSHSGGVLSCRPIRFCYADVRREDGSSAACSEQETGYEEGVCSHVKVAIYNVFFIKCQVPLTLRSTPDSSIRSPSRNSRSVGPDWLISAKYPFLYPVRFRGNPSKSP